MGVDLGLCLGGRMVAMVLGGKNDGAMALGEGGEG